MFLPVKNAGTDAWRNLDNTHVFDHKVTVEMARESLNATLNPQNEIEEEEEELSTSPGGSKIFKNIRYIFLTTLKVVCRTTFASYITFSTDYYQRVSLKSWFTNLEQTALNRSQQLPAPYKRLRPVSKVVTHSDKIAVAENKTKKQKAV